MLRVCQYFNSTIRRAQFPLRFTSAYNSKYCSLLFVVVVHAGCDKEDSLMRGGLCGKLHRPPSQLLSSPQHQIDSQILVDNRDFCVRHPHSTPQLGGPRRNIAIRSGVRKLKLEWFGKKSEDYSF